MVKPLDQMLTAWVTPALRARGWRKTSRIYRFASPAGDEALLYIQGASASPAGTAQFFVEIGPVTAASAAWSKVLFNYERTNTQITEALWRKRLKAPESVEALDPYGNPAQFGTHTWQLDVDDPGGAQRCGQALSHALLQWAPTAERWVDRHALRQFLADEHPALISWRVRGLTIVDDGPSNELDAVIADARAHDDTQFGDWLSERSSQRPR